MTSKKLITENDILSLIIKGKYKLEVCGNELFTPAALDKIKEKNIVLIEAISEIKSNDSLVKGSFKNSKRIAIGSDHTGYKAKKLIVDYFKDINIELTDVGTFNEKSCDYPDFAIKVANLVKENKVDYGIIFDATGIPSAITANKIPLIRAATCYNEFSARSAREHNNANIIVMGAKTLGDETIKSILNVWLKAEFLGDRHQKRLDKISKLESKNN